jgi:hypothetical protein
MIETIKIQTHVGSDGILKLKLPVGVHNVDCEVVVVFAAQPRMPQKEWEAFVNATYGSLADDPIERGEQPPLDIREAAE